MSRDLDANMLNAIASSAVFPFFTVDLDFESGSISYGSSTVESQPLYLWTGIGSALINGKTYTGTGQLLEIDAVEETTEVAARSASLTLSGIPSDILALALQAQYQGRKCIVKFGVYAETGNLLKEEGTYILKEDAGKIILDSSGQDQTSIVFSGYMDVMTITEGPVTSQIVLSVESRLVDLERARVRRYTAEDQKRRFPGDKGMDFVNAIQTQELFWGRR